MSTKKRGAFPALEFVFRRPDPIRGRDIGIGLRAFVGAGVFVVAVRGEFRRVGHIAAAAQVPLAEVRGAIAGRLQLPGKRRRFRVEEVGHFAPTFRFFSAR